MSVQRVTKPSFQINKREYLVLWVKNYIRNIILDTESQNTDKTANLPIKQQFLDAFGLSHLKTDQNCNLTGHKLWTLKNDEILSVKFILSLLHVMFPSEVQLDCQTFQSLLSPEYEEISVFNEICFNIKELFLSKNLDGKSLFKVISQQCGQKKISEKASWKLLELTFVIGYLNETQFERSTSILNTKCVFNIVSDVLNEFKVIMPHQEVGALDNFQYDLRKQQNIANSMFLGTQDFKKLDLETEINSNELENVN